MSNQVSDTGRSLVVFPGALGDLVCFLPALAEIAARRGQPPFVFCKGELTSLLRAAGIAEALPIDDRRVSWMFASEPPSEADAFYRGFRSIDSFSGKGVPEVERNVSRWQGSRGKVHPFHPLERIHLAAHFLRCVGSRQDIIATSEPMLPLPGTSHVPDLANVQRPLLVVHPGSGGRAKRWSRQGFAAIAERSARRGRTVIVVLGPAEDTEANEWRRREIRVATGLDVVALARLLGFADAYLGNDSGVSHLAGAVGARGVALFGPTDPDLWRPLSSRIRALRLDPWRPCDETVSRETIGAVDRALTAAALLARSCLDKVGPRH